MTNVKQINCCVFIVMYDYDDDITNLASEGMVNLVLFTKISKLYYSNLCILVHTIIVATCS